MMEFGSDSLTRPLAPFFTRSSLSSRHFLPLLMGPVTPIKANRPCYARFKFGSFVLCFVCLAGPCMSPPTRVTIPN